MAQAYDDTHSRVVAWAKIVLPLSALALLSTLFLASGKVDPTDVIPYSDIEIAELAREPRLTAPEFAGVTEDGASLSVTARSARPDPDGGAGASAEGIVAQVQAPDGFHAEITAGSGRFDPAGGRLMLSGAVEMTLSTGYHLLTETLNIATDRTRLTAPGTVHATAPFGQIEAGAMELFADAVATPHLLVFNNGVKLIYLPQN
jgi:lipopolysaccharide export system protein LptC